MLCVLFGSCGPMISCLEHFERVMCSKAFKKAHCYSHQHTSMMLEQTTTTPALRYVSHPLQMPNNVLERVNIVDILKYSEVHRWRWSCVPGSWTLSIVQERVPSWTDRILYKVKTVKVELQGYDAISSLKTSDHRPVKAHLAFKNV